MKNKKNFLVALMCLSGAFSASAQNLPGYVPGAPLPCCAHEQIHHYFQAHPEALEHGPQKIRKASQRPNSYVIPIVFHVFGEKFNGLSLNDKIIKDALKKTNEDFQGITANTGDDNPDFNKLQQNMNITFRLADIGPNGEATTGITYHRLESGFGSDYGYDEKIQEYAWDNKKYMNVYIMNDLYGKGITNNSGVSWYPNQYMTDNNIARVVYNGAYVGTNTNENFRRVLTHEFGHFLNLAHTFDTPEGFKDGCNPNGNIPNPGDYVDDTPPADVDQFGPDDRNCEGNLTNWTNYMNYSYDRTSMYTKGQVERMLDALDHSARETLWSEETSKKVFFSDTATKRIALSSRGDILENATNDGSFDGTFELILINGTLANKTYNSTDFTTENLPAGLTVKLTRVNDTKLKVSFEGKATENDKDTQFTITFKNSMLTSGELYSCKLPLTLVARPSYGITYVDCEDINISSVYNWQFIQLDERFEDSAFGLMWNSNVGNSYGNLLIESYGKQMVGKGRTILSVVNFGETIGASSKWTSGINGYPDLGTLVSKDQVDWKGKLAFVGIQFEGTLPGEILYGWMRISVSEDGKSFTLLDYAFNEEPGASIIAGQTGSQLPKAEVIFGSTTFTEDNNTNNGSFTQTVNIAIMGDNTFNKTGEAIYGTDFTAQFPKGLTPHLRIISSTQALLSLEGKAINHQAQDIDVTTLELKKSLFSKQDIDNLSTQLNILFLNDYKIIVGDLGISAGKGFEPWVNFKIPEVMEYSNGYGAWEYASKHLKIETYNKPMVGIEGTRNIAFLGIGTEIGSNSTWVFPVGQDSYPQLDLATSKYKDWYGKTGYAGISFPYMGATLYGWLEITVAQDGSYFTIHKFAYNEQPNKSINAGQIDLDPTSIQRSNSDENIFIFPNPVREQLSIVAPENSQIKVYDIAGTTIWNGSTNVGTTIVPVFGWAKGIYFVQLSKDGHNTTRKIIVD